MRPSATPSPSAENAAQDLVADLVVAGPDARADRRGLGADRAHAALDDPAGKPAPAAVQHRDASPARQRDRKAVGDQDERRETGRRRSTWASASGSCAPGRRTRWVPAPSRGAAVGAVNLSSDQDLAGIDAERSGKPAAVAAHASPLVAGQDRRG